MDAETVSVRYCIEICLRSAAVVGQAVSKLTIDSDGPSSKPAEVYNFFSGRLFEKDENTSKYCYLKRSR